LKIGLVVLNKNEIEALPIVLDKIPRDLFNEIIVIDGGSTDGSLELIRQHNFDVLVQESKGRGSGFALGFKFASKNALDFICFLSTDGNEDPLDLVEMVRIAKSESPEIIIASRMLKESWNEEDGHWFRPRKWGNKFFALFAYMLFGSGKKYISDPINGYRGLSLSAWNLLRPDAENFNIEYQISVRAYRRNLKVIEFPTKEGPRIGGKSGAKAVPTTIAMFQVLLAELGKKI
jgi:glycosyltransferase involved in cell wall biosynthesis